MTLSILGRLYVQLIATNSGWVYILCDVEGERASEREERGKEREEKEREGETKGERAERKTREEENEKGLYTMHDAR